ncbi:hypothetical protein [Phaeocystidibacter luteus]|uniref:Uncharacterized protein n=1 Tax=Phaeocystidibacter luteus TaxID=911197 RepID=A0A6N6RFL4_9FLAO|nr:hypothetical protein [Phaeocystidibacter luteus]KAB2809951.1 hypothetical protein F8C67_08710 [Phaeocystidibacter luteus]
MRLLYSILFALGCLVSYGQNQIDIRILDLKPNSESIEMEYETVDAESNGPSTSTFVVSRAPSLNLPPDLTVYIIHERLGLIRTHIRDLLNQGPSAWKNVHFRLHLENDQPVKLEQLYKP